MRYLTTPIYYVNDEAHLGHAYTTVIADQELNKQIQEWLEENPYQELLNYMQSRVMGQVNIAAVVANVYNYLKNVSNPSTGMMAQTHGNCNNMIVLMYHVL